MKRRLKCPECGLKITSRGLTNLLDWYIIEDREAYKKEILRRAAAIIGSIKTPKKARSSKENGKKGGRPPKKNQGLQKVWKA